MANFSKSIMAKRLSKAMHSEKTHEKEKPIPSTRICGN